MDSALHLPEEISPGFDVELAFKMAESKLSVLGFRQK